LFETNSALVYLGQCLGGPDSIPSVLHGHVSDVSNLNFTNGAAYGYYVIQCDTGYGLDPDIGESIACLDSGSWSDPLPQCNCKLFNFSPF
jgi:hypothetical protein